MSGSDITINTASGAMGGYLAMPASGRGPGLVVIQEIFGVNKVMRDLAEGYARPGRRLCRARLHRAVSRSVLADAARRPVDRQNRWRMETGLRSDEQVRSEDGRRGYPVHG